MSNKENLWRLEDENGKPAAEKPSFFKSFNGADIVATFNGKIIGKLQSISSSNYTNIGRELGSSRPLPYMHPSVDVNIMDGPVFQQEYLGSWDTDPRERSTSIRRETIEQEHPDILDLIMREDHRYEANFGRRPEYISLSVAAYRSFWVEVRDRHYYVGSGRMSEGRFMGLEIMCHPYQEQPVLALGRAHEEGIEGRLYREQS